MKKLLTFISLLAFILQAVPFITAQNNDKLPTWAYHEYKLPNGLRVIMHQDKSTPIVTVNTWYHVGSKNDAPGKTGFAHLFEHMMFQGSKNYNADYFKALQEVGGTNVNASTNFDRTNFYQTVPSNFLERALFMEADRMSGLLEAMTLEKLNNQRDVVKNERRQRYENQPYGTANEKIAQLVYPKEHPYHWTTIGSMDDITAASLNDVKAFFRQYYVPNNASLVIAGDFDPKQARAWVEKYFGSIAKGSDIKRPNSTSPKLNGEIRKTFEENVPLSRLYMVWHSVPEYSPDEAALMVLSMVLSSGRSSRLQSNLVQNKQIAQDIGAGNSLREIAGLFQITSTARPGKTLEEIEKEINFEIERIKQTPPTTEEINLALNRLESSLIFNLQTINGKAETMNAYATYMGKPDAFQTFYERLQKVTPVDVQRVVKTYLTGDRLVMSIMAGAATAAKTAPAGGRSAINSIANSSTYTAGQIDSTKVKAAESEALEIILPKAGPDPKISFPSIEKLKLSNGLKVWVVRHNELPIATISLVVKSGATAERADKSGIAGITLSQLNQGTKNRSADEVENQLQSLGIFRATFNTWGHSQFLIQTLTKNLDKSLDIFSDLIVNPTFPEEELNKHRQSLTTQIIQFYSQPGQIANIVQNKLLYGENHPYGRPIVGTENSVKNITRDDVQRFHRENYLPNNATLVVVGDVDSKTLIPKLERAFVDWKPGEAKTTNVSNATMSGKPGIYIFDKPGAAQSVISIGQLTGVERNDPDYFAIQVMNSILGGQFSSRLNMNLRESKGYTYGASSNWSFRRGGGAFGASANVQTAVTKESIAEFIKELRGIGGEIPITPKELEYNKQSLIRRYPAGFETPSQIDTQLVNLDINNLPNTYFNDYTGNINAVTIQDVNRVARKYLDPSKMAMVIVGDRNAIEPKLKELGFPVIAVDMEGKPVSK
ncbi:MAG: pitrilysin family protein [Pyrinomonadaceae bacterium]